MRKRGRKCKYEEKEKSHEGEDGELEEENKLAANKGAVIKDGNEVMQNEG